MKRKQIPHDSKLPVVLTFKERDLIRDNTFCNPDFGKLGVVEVKSIKLMMSLDEIEDVQGYVAAEANHTDNKKLQKDLDKIFQKFQAFLDTYDDQD
jgi:hypothetical protein